MGNLLKMDFFKLRKIKLFWISGIILLVVNVILPIISKLFADLLLRICEQSGDTTALADALQLVEIMKQPYLLSDIFRTSFGGLSVLLILIMISAVSFSYADITGGFVKNIAGQIPSRGYLAISKWIVIMVHNLVLMVCCMAGALIGQGVSRGINADSQIGEGLLEFFAKYLLLGGVCAFLLFFTTGICKRVLAIVLSVILSTGSLSIIYLPLNFGLSKLFNAEIDITKYAPDQMLTFTKINPWVALAEAAVLTVLFLFLTVTIMKKRDVH